MCTILAKLVKEKTIKPESYAEVIREVLTTRNQSRVVALLTLFTQFELNAEFLYQLILALREKQARFNHSTSAVEFVGTGGDGKNSLNISTAASLLAATMGINVIKHGNRASSSSCGSADVLEALGFELSHTDILKTEQLKQHHFAFLFAPNYLPKLNDYRVVRKELGFKTLFNLIGPLLNPAQLKTRVIGVANPNELKLYAKTVALLGFDNTLVVHSGGYDEITSIYPTHGYYINQNGIESYTLQPTQYALSNDELGLQGADPKNNCAAIQRLFAGVSSIFTDTVKLNVAVMLSIHQGLEIEDALVRIHEHIVSGQAREKFQAMTSFHQELKHAS